MAGDIACAELRQQVKILSMWVKSLILCVALLSAAFTLPCAAQSAATDFSREMVERYRQVIVLFADSAGMREAEREQADVVGKYLFHQNQVSIQALNAALEQDLAFPKDVTERFLDDVERNPQYFDADKLAFREVLENLAGQLEGATQARPVQLKRRIQEDLAALQRIQARYDQELGRVFLRFQARGIVEKRELWASYVTFLNQRYQRSAILKAHAALLSALDDTRGKPHPKSKNETDEVFGATLPEKTLVLTFDDGPHHRYTDRILAILKEQDIAAVFFQVGQNLGTVKDGAVRLGANAQVSRRILQAGHSLANHSYTHAFLPKLSAQGLDQEIDDTRQILEQITAGPVPLFRAPYGARNTQVMAKIKSEHLKSIMWNIDSLDWQDPVPKSIAQRVLDEVEKYQRGIVLFHDIHARTVDALPLVITALKEAGYRFAIWDGQGFTVPSVRGTTQIVAPAAPRSVLYRESHAVVIGIDDYAKWPKLRYAVNDARGMRELLMRKYGFKPENVHSLFNQDATRKNILSLLGDKLAESVQKEDRVFIFYAGHGATRHLPSGRDLGYIVPVEADVNNYQGQSISMSNFQDIAEAIPAKHVFFVMDSCYSGLALTRGAGRPNSENFIREVAKRSARQMLTAGGADQQVADGGPNGHSVFTWTLMQALEGSADLNHDGVITATELASYTGPVVSSLSLQTPAFGSLPGSEGGEFLFELKPNEEFLDATSAQLDVEAIRLNREIERTRAVITQKAERNRQLQATLASAQQQLAQIDAPPTASVLNDRGLALYKQKSYPEAVEQFLAALKLDPAHVLSTNNLGFTYYKMARYAEAVVWFEKTLQLDPQRAIAYINLGDAYLKLDKKDSAKRAFETYLELAPSGRSIVYAKEKLASLAL